MLNLHAPFQLGDHSIHISASIGVSFYPEHGIDAESLLRVADHTMYHVKHHQKNGFMFADDAKSLASPDKPT
jgi:predicted signal transduction protein with EAL and GGDEF domain